MRLENLRISDIHPYENNPRRNDGAVNAVAESIRQCTYITPIVVDEDHVILAGHTRYKALKALGYDAAPCLVCEGLTEEQKRKYRYLDNRTFEMSFWKDDELKVFLRGLEKNRLEDCGFKEEEVEQMINGFNDEVKVAKSEIKEMNEQKDTWYCPECGWTGTIDEK